MSIKVFNTYKLRKASDLWPLVSDIKTRATKNVQKVLRDAYANLTVALKASDPELLAKQKEWAPLNLHESSPVHEWTHEMFDYRTRLMVAHDRILKHYKESAAKPYRTGADFDASVVFRELRGNVYVSTFADFPMNKVFAFLQRDPRVRDYHYQNQSDRPRVPAKDWEERKAVWEEMADTGKEFEQLVLEICTVSSFYRLDPYTDMVKTYMKKAKIARPRKRSV